MPPGALVFAELYARPDRAAVTAALQAHAGEARSARGGAALVECVRRRDRARSRLETLRQIAELRYHQDTRDPAAASEQAFWGDASPDLRELDADWARALLESPHRGSLDAAFGPQLLLLAAGTAVAFAPAIRGSIAEEARLAMRYVELVARPEIELAGGRHSLGGLARFFVDPDRRMRLEAQQAREAFLARNGPELEALFDRLVALRDGMGRALGHGGFTPLAYRLLHRTWGPSDAEAFRRHIREVAVPVAQRLYRIQARRLGLPRLLFHDEPLSDLIGNPRPLGDSAFLVERARALFRRLGPELGDFFDRLADGGLLDLEPRPGKAGGAFCAHLPDLGLPFVFATCTGTEADVRVLTHECGHALQIWRSRHQPVLEYRLPTLEACEVHSMGLEVLAEPHLELFFGADAAWRYVRLHLEQALLLLPYLAAIDEFQHEVYARPRLRPAERDALWRGLERAYLPQRDYGGSFPHLERGTLWQRQVHVFTAPFYYLDYALAQTVALQLRDLAEADRARAVEVLLALCGLGGSRSFEEMVGAAGLASPFRPGVLGQAVGSAIRALGRLDPERRAHGT